MLGFIKKDLLMIKENFKKILFIIIIYGFLALQGNMDISFIIPFLVVILITSCFSYDEYNHFDAYAISLPNGKTNAVKGKYLTSLLILLLSLIFVFLLSLIVSLINHNNFNTLELLQTLLISFTSVMIIISIMFPFIFKFKVEKGRIILLIIIFSFIFLSNFLFKKKFNFVFLETILNKYWYLFLILLPLVMFYISYLVSRKIYLKKEF